MLPIAVFDGGNQDYCSAAVAPGTRVRDYEGKLGFLAVEFAQPVAVSGFTMGVKGSCTWDMPTAFVFQGSSDGTSWQDLADVQGPLVWDPCKNSDTFSICRAVRLANPKSITISDRRPRRV